MNGFQIISKKLLPHRYFIEKNADVALIFTNDYFLKNKFNPGNLFQTLLNYRKPALTKQTL